MFYINLLAGEASTGNSRQMIIMIVVWVAVIALMYFLMFRPQRKQQQERENMQNALEPGDSIMTTSGFYGVVLSVDEDTVIVEFGNNKNCRIPMHRQAIAEVEKAGSAVVTEEEA